MPSEDRPSEDRMRSPSRLSRLRSRRTVPPSSAPPRKCAVFSPPARVATMIVTTTWRPGSVPFAAGRIDVSRFARLLDVGGAREDPGQLVQVEKAFEILRALSSGGPRAFYSKVSPGTHLRDAVASRFADMGRGFAAARIAGLAALGALSAERRRSSPRPSVSTPGARVSAGWRRLSWWSSRAPISTRRSSPSFSTAT